MIKTAVENHQNLIVEGCYVPFDWRKDFDACEIESRISDEDCTLESLQADNQSIIDGFQRAGEPVILIEEDYEKIISLLLE